MRNKIWLRRFTIRKIETQGHTDAAKVRCISGGQKHEVKVCSAIVCCVRDKKGKIKCKKTWLICCLLSKEVSLVSIILQSKEWLIFQFFCLQKHCSREHLFSNKYIWHLIMHLPATKGQCWYILLPDSRGRTWFEIYPKKTYSRKGIRICE